MNCYNLFTLYDGLQVKEREAELEQCYMRMEKGEAPNDIIEKEWMKKLRDQARKRQEKETALMVSNN